MTAHPHPPGPSAPLAAVLHDGHGIAEPVLKAFVARLQARGVRVRGLLQDSAISTQQGSQQGGQGGSACQRHMELVDVQNGQRYLISQELGQGSQACCLDAAGVAAASVVLRRALHEQPELIVANRFGKIESEGSGLRQEIAAAAAAGIPLLTAVDQRFLPEWQAFCGGLAVQLPPDVQALEQWWRQHARPDAQAQAQPQGTGPEAA
ncbi:MAG: DUF2478 domain-containing protein [Comamonadaceae bacterium]|nr:DUF2478 domain-containing protein [Comamonadaceae bacterium]